MLERTPYFDPDVDSSTQTSVVRPPSNPQQAAVTIVDAPAFYNQNMVTPLPGLRNTRPAILRPDRMYDHRWPNVGPYRGMTPQPFSWERAQMNGLGDVTQEQRNQHAALIVRASDLANQLGGLRQAARTEAQVGQIALIEGNLEQANALLREASNLPDVEFAMALDDAAFELDQVQERINALGSGSSSSTSSGSKTWVWIGGGLLAAGAFAYWMKKRQGY